MRKALQIALRVLSLALFCILAAIGKMQLWMVIFLAGLLASFFFGRLYCGWVCPIGTLTRGITYVKSKLKIGSAEYPDFLKKPALRYGILAAFLAAFAFAMATGKKLPVLPIILVIGFALSLIFPEELFHRYLCPYGTLLHMTAKKPVYNIRVEQKACVNCGICARVCPAAAVSKESRQYAIHESDCLVCFDCVDKCSRKAIAYRKR